MASNLVYSDQWENFIVGGASEIEEEESSSSRVFDVNENGALIKPLDTIKEVTEGSMFSINFSGGDDDAVYVVVGNLHSEETSMDALNWTIDHLVVPSSTMVYLLHVFPETKYIPTPLGKLPINQVNPEQKENYMAQERSKRREFLQKFLNVCYVSQIKVDTILIESDMESKAYLDLMPILNIRKLVFGTTKSNIRKLRSKKGNGTINHVLHKAPEFCDVKIIHEGKEMSELKIESPSSSPSPSPRASTEWSAKFSEEKETTNSDKFACGCFKNNLVFGKTFSLHKRD